MAATSTRIGTSGGTPKGAVVPLLDMSKKTQCVLFGEGITRPTQIFVKPDNLQLRIRDYVQINQTLVCPKQALAAEIKRIGELQPDGTFLATDGTTPPVKAQARTLALKSGAKPIIHMKTGRFYLTADEAGRGHRMTGAAVSYQLKSDSKTVQFRYATPAEIDLALRIRGWKAPVDAIN